MTRDEWISLPPALALRVLWDALPAGALAILEQTPAPQVPRAPKYDTEIYRKDGVTYASEYDAEGLRYWRDRAKQSTDPKYAESDAKKAKALDFWIEYRAYFPNAPWTGERNRQTVTADTPSPKPRIHPRQARRDAPRDDAPPPDFGDDATSVTGDDIPF